MKVKIVLYNILNGFCNDNPPFKLNTNRLKNFLRIIKKQNPDVLILTEAYFWPFAKKVNFTNLSGIFEDLYNQYISLAYKYFRWAPIIFSKYSIINFDTSMSKNRFNYLRTNIKVANKKLMIDVFHPHPDTTEKQKTNFLKSILKNSGNRYIIAGDFNALSPDDNYDNKNLIKGYKSFMKRKGKPKVNDMLKCLTLKTLLKENLIDTFKTKNPFKTDFTMPTNLRSKNKDSAIRIDYILCSKNFKVIDSGIIKDKLTEKISDHYPIYGVIEI